MELSNANCTENYQTWIKYAIWIKNLFFWVKNLLINLNLFFKYCNADNATKGNSILIKYSCSILSNKNLYIRFVLFNKIFTAVLYGHLVNLVAIRGKK